MMARRSVRHAARAMAPRLLALCSLVLLTACEVAVESGLAEEQANEVIVTLDARGIPARKERDESSSSEVPAFVVRVPEGDVANALQALRAAGLPRTETPGTPELFGKPGLVPTPTEEHARYAAALSGDLARTLETMDGVIDARVHVALPDARDTQLDAPAERPRASVLLRYRGARPPYDPAAVRSVVAGAVHGMTPEDVAVVGVPARVDLAAGTAGSGLSHVGPIAVARSSAGALKGLLAGALVGYIVLAVALMLAMRRRRSVEPAGAEPTPG